MSGSLVICGLPIGNSEDISARTLATLKKVDLIVAEDTRTASLLLSQFKIKKKMLSYHDFSKEEQLKKIIDIILSGQTIALISDAGMPMISDPGYHLVQAAVRYNIKIQVIPGPTAFVVALALSGLPSNRFCFEGFLNRKPAKRQEQLSNLLIEERTMIFYEAPHRVIETLEDMLNIFGTRNAFVCRELTKKYEEHFRGTIEEIIFKIKQKSPRGEYVIVIAGNKSEIKTLPKEYEKLKDILIAKKLSAKDISEIISETYNLSKNQVKEKLFYNT